MDEHAIKIKRSNNFIKILMAFTVLLFVNQYYQSQTFDFGAFASTIALLAFFRGLMLSPIMLTSPMKAWFKNNIGFSKESYKYFLLAIVLGFIGSL